MEEIIHETHGSLFIVAAQAGTHLRGVGKFSTGPREARAVVAFHAIRGAGRRVQEILNR